MITPLISSTTIEFEIPGTPQQQGSKTRMPNGYMAEANKNLAPWRTEAIYAAQQAHHGDASEWQPIMRPVFVAARFFFPRPKSHYGTGRNAGVLKDSAPFYYASAPDLDKLQRALGDVLTQASVIQDDRLIVKWLDPFKAYTGNGPRTEVEIEIVGD